MLENQTPTSPAWEFIERRQTYRFWKYTDTNDQPIYNVTETDTPPPTEAGYYSDAYLFSVKGVHHSPTLTSIFAALPEPEPEPEPELIYAYTRQQALEDGVLVDLNQIIPLRESGYRYPVACTASVWAIIEKTAKGRGAADHAGIVWDILHMSRQAIIRRWETGNLFRVMIGRKWHTLKIECGPGDDLAPVLTILLPEED